MDYSQQVSQSLAGRTIANAVVDGHGIEIAFTDGCVFTYEASDGGYSTFGIKSPKGGK